MGKKQREKRRVPGLDISTMPGWLRREQRRGNGIASRKRTGWINRRILSEDVRDGFEVSYHATKGYRIRNTGQGAS